jgi:molecular chaperone GrpE (heat shock protein)
MKDKMKHLSEDENAVSLEQDQGAENLEKDTPLTDAGEERSREMILKEMKDMETRIEELSLKVEELEEEKKQLNDSAARFRADLYNYRQRTERERSREKKLAREGTVLEILPVLDNLHRALSFPEGTDPASVLDGVVMVQRQFMNVLESMGVKEIPSIGEKFSPEFHEAVAMIEVAEPEKDGLIVEEFMKGYILSEKVIRPARVQVGKYVKPQKEEN